MVEVPPRRKVEIDIAVPSSIVSEAPDLREKTRKVGYVGRAAAVFRVSRICVYKDSSDEDLKLVSKLLEYQSTPPYLRKALFPLTKELKYAALLPPLRTPTHDPDFFNVRVREGIVKKVGAGFVVEAGLHKPVLIKGGKGLKPGERVFVRVLRDGGRFFIGEIVEDVDFYTHFTVKTYSSPQDFVDAVVGEGALLVGTDREGADIRSVAQGLRRDAVSKGRVVIVFGGPKAGIFEIFDRELLSRFVYIVNTAPMQGTATVRTEEAVFITLAIFNLMLD